MTEEWCCEKLENLKIKENRLSTLTEIRVRLNATPNLETKVTNRLLSSPEIYDCLEEDDRCINATDSVEPIDLVSDILSICMANLTLRQNDFPRLLHRALLHKRARIRALALNTILKELQNQIDNDISEEILHHILVAVQEPETQLGSPALAILCLVLESHLCEHSVKAALLEALKKSEVVKCRLYELAVNLGKRSAATLQKVEFILDHSLAELDNDDVLLQVNVLEILVSLAEQNHGLIYLEKRQVFDVIGKRVEEMEQHPLDRLLIPGIMKFFGKISSVQPQKIINGYPHMIRCLFESFNSGDTSILPAAFDTLANLTHSQQGVLLLEQNYTIALKDVFESYSAYLRNLPTDLKIRAFSSLENIFSFVTAVATEISSILLRWFNYLNDGSNNMQFLMDFCRNPFPDIKISSLNLIGSLCLYRWGIDALKNTAGFLEYLLDRKIEFDKDAKYAKFCVIKILADSDAFDVQTNIQLRTYVNEGAYFVQSIMDVAVEGN